MRNRSSTREGQRARMHKWATGSEAPEVPWMPTHTLSHFSHVQLCVSPWTVARQAPLSVRFSKQDHWSGLPFPSPGDLRDPGTEPVSLTSPALAGRFFTTSAAWMSRMKVLSYLVSQKPGLASSRTPFLGASRNFLSLKLPVCWWTELHKTTQTPCGSFPVLVLWLTGSDKELTRWASNRPSLESSHSKILYQ